MAGWDVVINYSTPLESKIFVSDVYFKLRLNA